MEQFIMNNCKIANELRKYRDLTGCVNRVSLSDDPENYATMSSPRSCPTWTW